MLFIMDVVAAINTMGMRCMNMEMETYTQAHMDIKHTTHTAKVTLLTKNFKINLRIIST